MLVAQPDHRVGANRQLRPGLAAQLVDIVVGHALCFGEGGHLRHIDIEPHAAARLIVRREGIAQTGAAHDALDRYRARGLALRTARGILAVVGNPAAIDQQHAALFRAQRGDDMVADRALFRPADQRHLELVQPFAGGGHAAELDLLDVRASARCGDRRGHHPALQPVDQPFLPGHALQLPGSQAQHDDNHRQRDQRRPQARSETERTMQGGACISHVRSRDACIAGRSARP